MSDRGNENEVNALTRPTTSFRKNETAEILRAPRKPRLADMPRYVDAANHIINPGHFLLPEISEYYANSLEGVFEESLAEALNEKDGDMYRAAFYMEEPFSTRLGYHENEKVFVIKGAPKISERDVNLGTIDADSLLIDAESLEDGGFNPFTIAGITYDSFTHYMRAGLPSFSTSSDKEFGVRFFGFDAAEIGHYSEKIVASDDVSVRIRRVTPAQMLTDRGTYIYITNPNIAQESIRFINFGFSNTWHQIKEEENMPGGQVRYMFLTSEGPIGSGLLGTEEYTKGREQTATLVNLLRQATDMRLVIDATNLSTNPDNFPTRIFYERYESSINNNFRALMNRFVDTNIYKQAGFNFFGLDFYRRFLGTMYVKVPSSALPGGTGTGSVWVNVSKYVIAHHYDDITVWPGSGQPMLDSTFSFLPRVFGLHTYGFKNRRYFDAFGQMQEELDDRRTIQKKLTGKAFHELKEWSVMVGDSLFMVPPTSIRSVSRTTSEQQPLIRARGSMVKGRPKSQKMIEMTLYFNGEEGINGMPYEAVFPNGEKQTYHMNGLRALIAQFKLTPFLPIDNNYINHTLNIDAVTLVNLQIATMPDYPKCVAATLSLQEFEYRVYMPELPVDIDRKENDESYNVFAGAINFEVMRWHYQQALLRGEEATKYPYNSREHQILTMGGKTALAPTAFDDSQVTFYLPNEEQLVRKKHLKMEAQKSALDSVAKPTGDTIALAAQLAGVFDDWSALQENQTYVDAVRNISKDFGGHTVHGFSNQKDELMLYVGDDAQVRTVTQADFYAQRVQPILDMMNSAFNTPVLTGGTAKQHMRAIGAGVYEATISMVFHMEMRNYDNQAWLIFNSLAGLGADEQPFKDRTLTLSFKGKFRETENTRFRVVRMIEPFRFDDNADFHGLAYASRATLAGNFQQAVLDMKQDIDQETEDSLVYVEYDLGNLRVSNASLIMSNIISEIGLNGIDGYAPQFLGGHDIMIELAFETTDRTVAIQLQALPMQAARIVREYRDVLPHWPLRINSHLSAMAGVYDVLVQTVELNTVPNHPGTYQISMQLMAVDRTLRNREALKRLDMPKRSGAAGSSAATSTAVRGYFDLEENMADVPLYPDLELPMIGELQEKGFYFIKHLMSKDTHYADPDFYFSYGHALTGEIFRESIVNYFANEYVHPEDTKLKDSFGSETIVGYTKEEGLRIEWENETAIRYRHYIDKNAEIEMEAVNKAAKEEQDEWAQSRTAHPADKIRQHIMEAGIYESWDITSKIKCHFLEDRYTALLKDPGPEEQAQANALEADIFIPIERALEKVLRSPMQMAANRHGRISEDALSNISHVTTEAAREMLNNADIKEAARSLGVTDHNSWGAILFAAASGMTGQAEFSEFKTNWHPRSTLADGVTPYAELWEEKTPKNLEEAIEKGIVIGLTGIRLVNRENYKRITGRMPKPGIPYAFLDPYYAEIATLEEIREHKERILLNQMYAYKVLMRQLLFWLDIMAKDRLLPSVYTHQSDVLGREAGIVSLLTGLSTWEGQGHLGAVNQHEPNEHMDALLAMIKNEGALLKNGLLYAAGLAHVVGGDEGYLGLMKSRNYTALNNMVAGVMGANVSMTHDPVYNRFRRYTSALAGTRLAKNMADIGSSQQNAGHELLKLMAEKVYIEAALDPRQYILHSFYDMVTNDARGRMLRAFPTFYMVMLDEGSTLGRWKLHDNFYNVNAIQDIQVTKSRKNPADTAQITMTNMFQTFTLDDEDTREDYEYDFKDVFNQMFRRNVAFRKMDLQRRQASHPDRIKLDTGIRIHLKMGYGANASTLPTMFNGVVTEIGAGETVVLIAQGDGIELTNPIMLSEDGDNMLNQDNFFLVRWFQSFVANGASPKTILNAVLSSQGGWLKKKIRAVSDGQYFNHNPFGIINFGDPDVKVVFQNGEQTQNIYEAIDTPVWSKSKGEIATEYALESPPNLSLSVFGKSFWDILHICGSVSPDFIVGTAPFGMRSTVFHGAPHFYYAYNYTHDENRLVYEKRKPFQQYHIYTSFSDIIANNIKTSDFHMKTAAVGLYSREGWMSGGVSDRVGPIWADFEIYPERQKTMTVDTQLYSKGYTRAARVVPWLNSITDKLAKNGGKKIAWRMTAHALKESIKDMYQGELMITGDPTVKPHDRMFIYDTYNNVNGQCLVESVSHVMSLETGFVSAVYADAIATVDDQHEIAKQTMAGSAVSKGVAVAASAVALSTVFGKTAQPLVALTKSFAKTAGKNTEALLTKFGAHKYYTITQSKLTAAKAFLTLNYTAAGANAAAAVAAGTKAAAVAGVLPSAVADAIVKAAAGKGSVAQATGVAAKLAASSGKNAAGVISAAKTGAANALAASAKAAAASSAMVTAGVLMAAQLAMFMIATSLVYEAIERKMKSYRAIQIFPLKKNGRVWTAGLNGSKGIVYGSPSYNDPGVLGNLFLNITRYKTNGTTTQNILNALRWMFVSDGMREIAEGVYAKNPLPANEDGTRIDDVWIQRLLESMTVGTVQSHSAYNAAIMVRRERKPSEGDSFLHYTVSDINLLEVFPESLKHLGIVMADSGLRAHHENNKFMVIHDDADSEGLERRTFTLTIDSQAHRVNGIKVNGQYDLPLLNRQAIAILSEMANRYFGKKYDKRPGGYLILKTALQPGVPGWESTGFSFTVESSGLDFEQIINEIQTEQASKTHGESYIVYKKGRGPEYRIFIHPPANR